MKDNVTPIIFIAMFWGGGGPYRIFEIVGVYDWVNRSIPTREEMNTAFTSLLALGLMRGRLLNSKLMLNTRKIGVIKRRCWF